MCQCLDIEAGTSDERGTINADVLEADLAQNGPE